METKILKAVFGGGRYAVTNKRTRTDYGQVLEISGVDLPSTFECIFSNSATSSGVGKKMIGSNQRVLIPDEYLKTGQTIYAWVLVHDSEDDGRHMYSIKIPVDDMPDTSPEEPTPVEQSVISQAIAALNTAVGTTTQKAQEASDSADRAEHAADGIEAYAERAEAAQSASESARDRAVEAETSARTSAATATEKASEAISSATTASQSALDAEQESERAKSFAESSAQAAEAARQFAIDAGNRAYDASERAQEASGYASNANTSAQTASQKASEAAQSASTAVQAKTDAETAKTASQTAQGLAESARDSAISAQESAEDARDEAQNLVDGISGKVEQIDSNTTRIESLEDDRYKPYPTDIVSGSIASFPDGADDIPLKSCIVQVEPVQEGSGDPSPDNVRPISGWTGCEVQRTGKNVYPYESIPKYTYSWFSNYTFSGATHKVFIKANTDYVLSFETTDATQYVNIRVFDVFGALVENEDVFNARQGVSYICRYQSDRHCFSISGYVSYKFVLIKSTADVWIDCVMAQDKEASTSPMLELGSTATDYEPYQGNTYPITFPSEAGIVYGAYVDVINGELVVDTGFATLNGSETWREYPSYNGFYTDAVNMKYGVRQDGVSNMLINSKTGNSGQTNAMWLGVNSARLFVIGVYDSMGSTLDEFKAYLAEHPLQVTYPLAEPIRYPLTPTEIKTLYGQNNLWADTGDTEVEYRADTTLYISRLTEPDADMIADNNITNGSYFMVGNNLYLATANIASGASVIVGTNATKVSLAQALNAIKA